MTDVWRFCPQCGRRRVGYFRFCEGCKLDYDALVVAPAPRASVARPRGASTPVVSVASAAPASASAARDAAATAVPVAAAPASVVPATRAFPPEQPAPAPTPAMPFVLTPPATPRPEPAVLQRETPTLTPEPAPVQSTPVASVPVSRVGPARPGAHVTAAPSPAGGSLARTLARRASPLLRYAFVGLIGLVAVGVLTNMVSRATSGAPDATGGTAGATAVAPTTSIAEPTTGAAETPHSPSFAPRGPTLAATVSSVIDGDTIRVEIDGTEYPLRYAGIDAPDPDSTDPDTKAYADAATAANIALVNGRDVFLEKDVSETDAFDRLLRHVWVVDPNGVLILVNAELVRQGLAEVTTFPPDEKYVDVYVAAEDQANEMGVGVWGPPPGASPAVGASPPSSARPSPSGPGSADCHASYDPCLPIVDDLDCADVRRLGHAPVTIKGIDEYRLDPDGDGQGCG